jgi:hypothetical protein
LHGKKIYYNIDGTKVSELNYVNGQVQV